VSKGATKRAERSLEEFGPSPLARARTPSAKRRLVGLLLSPHTEPHLSESVAWFQEAAWAHDYDVLAYSFRDHKQQAMSCLRMLLERRVDAIASFILRCDCLAATVEPQSRLESRRRFGKESGTPSHGFR